MSYAATIIVRVPAPATSHRVLATKTAERLRELRSWIRRNAETWRGALAEHETHFEAWVTDSEGVPALHVRHSKEFGDEGEVSTRAMLREMLVLADAGKGQGR